MYTIPESFLEPFLLKLCPECNLEHASVRSCEEARLEKEYA